MFLSNKNHRNKKNKGKKSVIPFAMLISYLLISLHIQNNDCPELHTCLTSAIFDKTERYLMLKCLWKGAVVREYTKLIFLIFREVERKVLFFVVINGYKLKLNLYRFP